MTWPFAPLVPLAYSMLVLDPPWAFKTRTPKGWKKSPQAHYACMTIEDICALPVGQLAAPDCVLFLWATWPLLAEAQQAMGRWGFRYVSGGAWHKRTKNGCSAFGTGYRVRSSCEPFLIGVLGRPQTSRAHRNIIEGLARQHSRKPEEAYAWCESYLPGARRAEVFSRESRPGWEHWGNEAGKFDEVAA